MGQVFRLRTALPTFSTAFCQWLLPNDRLAVRPWGGGVNRSVTATGSRRTLTCFLIKRASRPVPRADVMDSIAQQGDNCKRVNFFRENCFFIEVCQKGRAKGNFCKRNWRRRQFGEVAKRHSRSPAYSPRANLPTRLCRVMTPSKLFGKSFESFQRWRSPTEVKGGPSHVRKRQAPPRPCRFAPTILRLTEVFRYQTHQYPHSHKITLWADPSVGATQNISTTHERP